MDTAAQEHKEASLRQQEHRTEKTKVAPKVVLDTDKCEQVWASLEHSANEAVQTGNAADVPSLVAQAVRKARADFDQMVAALTSTDANAQVPMEVDASFRKRPLEELVKDKTNDDDDDFLPESQARQQDPAAAAHEPERRRSQSPRKEQG